ncbi:MFS transporter [Halomarina ordinaria]|uniref:Nitrate/nitrite transporter n=1 Tax=Halomarina ordinaria TaxID=3033939 RepID=A0ABD5U9D2_9EURY|nr:MFS transporter [Halomarina sp. PSRA2]
MVNPYRPWSLLADATAELRRDGSAGVLLVVSLGWFLSLGVRIVYPALLPQVTAEFGVDNATTGLFVGVLWTTYALLQFPGGALADVVGERLVLAGSIVLTTGAVGALVLATTLELFVVATVLLGLGTGLYGTTRLTVISAVYDRMATTAISVSQASGNVGNVVLSAGAGVVSAYLGWRWGFGYLLPLLVVCAVGLWLFVPRRASAATGDEPFSRTMRKVAATVRRPRVLAVTALLSLNMFLYQSVTGFLPTYLVAEKGLAPGVAATVYSVFFATAIGVQFLSGLVADRRGNPVAIFVFVGLSVPAFVLLTVVDVLPALVATVLLLSSLLGGMPAVNAAGVGSLPEEIQGSGFGLLRTCYIAFGAVGPPTVGVLADVGRFDLAFLFLGGVALVTSVWGLLFERVG